MSFMSKKQENQQSFFKQHKLLLYAGIAILILCMIFVCLKIFRASVQAASELGGSPSLSFANEATGEASQFQLDDVEAEMPTCAKNSEQEKVNLNTATKEELKALKGIGDVRAEAIITHRRENGNFQSIYELLKVSGIGEKIFEGLRNQIIV